MVFCRTLIGVVVRTDNCHSQRFQLGSGNEYFVLRECIASLCAS